MERLKQALAFRLTRFVIVGLVNTLINFLILNVSFYALNQSKLVSSFIATSCAMLVSFLLNRVFVFVDKEKPAQKFVAFLAVTFTGTLLVQNSVYFIGISTLGDFSKYVAGVANLGLLNTSSDFMLINLSNAIASFAVMLWNYNGYRILVFNGKRHGNEITEERATESA